MSHIPVEGHSDLVRDKKTGAVLNINRTSIENAREAKLRRKSMATRLEMVEKNLDEMKAILEKVIENNG